MTGQTDVPTNQADELGYAAPVLTERVFSAWRFRLPTIFGIKQSRLRSALEVLVVLGGFALWFWLNYLFPELWTQLDAQVGLPLQVVLHALVALILVAAVSSVGGFSLAELGLVSTRRMLDIALGFAAIVPAYIVNIISVLALSMVLLIMGQGSLEHAMEGKQEMLLAVAEIPSWLIVPLTLLIGIYEEILFRGFVLGRMGSLCRNTVLAVLVSALLFGFFHAGSQGLFGLVQTTVIGIFFGLLTVWRGSLWPAIACHAGIDAIGLLLSQVLKPFIEQFGQGSPAFGG